MMLKIDQYYPEGEKTDISELKIYWDTKENVFRHRFECPDCGIPLGCYCYQHLDNIIEGIECGAHICRRCWLLRDWNLEEEWAVEVAGDVDKVCPGHEFSKKVRIMHKLYNADVLSMEAAKRCNEKAEKIEDELTEILKNIPEEKLKYIGFSTDYDGEDGVSCEI